MVVDDNASHRGLVSEILLPLGFVVLEAQDAYECLDAINDADIDFIFTGYFNAGMDGWELLMALRQAQVTQPIIMLSANAFEQAPDVLSNEDDIKLYNDYAIKPIKDNILLDKIAHALNLQCVMKVSFQSIDWIMWLSHRFQ